MRLRVACVLVAATLLAARTAHSQSLEGSVSTFTVQNHVRFASTLLEQSGQWVAADGAVKLGRVRLGAGVAMGSLGGSDDALHPDRKARATTVTAHFFPARWVGTGLSAEAKRFDTDAGSTVWRLIGANVQMTPALGDALEGLADISYWPSAAVVNGPTMSMAFRALLGATYRIMPPVHVRLAYRFERFDFNAQGSGAARLEQFRGAMLGAVIRLGR
jgi:opacity protein-like surface antigen